MIGLLLTWAALIASAATSNGTTANREAPAVIREWTDATGTKQVRAKLIRIDGEKLWLNRPDGKLATTTLSELSRIDRQYVASYPHWEGTNTDAVATLVSLPRQVLKK